LSAVNCTDVLLNVAKAARLFHASDGTGFADPIIDGPPRNLGCLRRAQTFLRTLGIEIVFGREGRLGTRTIRITAVGENRTHGTVSGVSDHCDRAGLIKPSSARTGTGALIVQPMLTVVTQNSGLPRRSALWWCLGSTTRIARCQTRVAGSHAATVECTILFASVIRFVERRVAFVSKTNKSKTEIAAPSVPERAQRLALFGPPPLIEGEDAAAYDQLLARICAAVKPVDIIDEIFITDVVPSRSGRCCGYAA
jgi:hypothetical protein